MNITKYQGGFAVLKENVIYYCSTEKDLIELINETLESETNKGICSQAFKNDHEALKEFKNILKEETSPKVDKIQNGDIINFNLYILNEKENFTATVIEKGKNFLKLQDLKETYMLSFDFIIEKVYDLEVIDND